MRFTTSEGYSVIPELLLSIKQRYKLNAIHNWLKVANNALLTIVNKAKIQIECDSQLHHLNGAILLYYCQ